jgi:hypothetical protein
LSLKEARACFEESVGELPPSTTCPTVDQYGSWMESCFGGCAGPVSAIPSDDGTCCYRYQTSNQCGRPFSVRGMVTVAPIARRSDW